MEILTTPAEYAKFLGIPEDLANFNVQYLIDAQLVEGESFGSAGTTKKRCFLHDLTSFGVEAVEGLAGRELAVNYIIINMTGLDPSLGFLHEDKPAATPLVYDFQEPYRWLVDYTVLRMVLSRTLT